MPLEETTPLHLVSARGTSLKYFLYEEGKGAEAALQL